ncbi:MULTISPECIES: ABC transporter ATP-binding protein [Mesorhizobium]|uniref:ABC transporter ATP-binding protein/permease n=3 Tax=Mesorhizobium TaxID=68287 RepID=A0AB38TAY1_9HYPH|nr:MULTISPECIES: ABC transporter ATP-binding protein [Mesorhizobium]RUY45371.1 ABC transporter ATP-binding protein [Mesorhizobium sp. M7A.F.Ca.CA.001.13.2.1]MDF3215108.1 ABC transporter ATP-binding protein [Mesorhizobium ciceri]RUY66570.1 ABC transporter ATP-binding protein [Mesorhizobium sp. M7A.F.Ca.CA.001.05.1.1]RUY72320.1 ABC transporter ATP-binding protein [Mesorhizobium sp. M7A.F.Ca.CA.001.13.1.1]RUZ07769.1 ABC transporter ATP-binding protein [Mesorhizobium sp. M7A.F.Ca.CA.001.04.2.1]
MFRFFRSTENQRLVARLIRESFYQHRFGYGAAILSMLVVAATTGASAWILKEITDEFVVFKRIDRVNLIAGGVATIFILKGLANFIQAYFMSRVGNAIIADRQRKIYDRILAQGIEFYHSTSSSDLITRMTNNAQAARNVLDLVVTSYVRDLLSLVVLVGVMVWQQPALSIICFVVGPLAIYGVNRILKRVRKFAAMEFRSVGQIVQVMQETAIGVRVVKSFNLEGAMRNRMYKAVSDVENRANNIATLEAATSPVMETLAGLAIAGAIFVSGFLVLQGGQMPGNIMAFIGALLFAYEPAKRLARVRISLESGIVGVRMMFELADQPLTLVEKPDAKPLLAGPGEIRFDAVDFAYQKGPPVLDRFDLTLAPGKMTALVGPSGGGKSTILNLIMRMYDPQSGRVLFDGHDISHATLASLREKIAYVSQDTFLFAGTIMHNIRLGREGATDDEVIAAAKAANAHDFISAQAKGYETDVGENGGLLSGGQRQRISIARAMLRNAEILLLDEATSALDAESEALFRDALQQLTEGRTTIVIAHRLSTVHQADTIVVLEAGKVVESGPHKTLLQQGGLYQKLYEYQLMP